MNKKQQSVALFKEGFCCSQAILSTYAKQWGMEPEIFLKIGDAFGAGIGAMAGICGVVTGAIMVIGLKYGRTHPEDEDAKQKTRTLIKKFVKQFEERNNSIQCKQLLGVDISIPETMEMAEEEGLFDTFCPKLIETGVDILEELLNEK